MTSWSGGTGSSKVTAHEARNVAGLVASTWSTAGLSGAQSAGGPWKVTLTWCVASSSVADTSTSQVTSARSRSAGTTDCSRASSAFSPSPTSLTAMTNRRIGRKPASVTSCSTSATAVGAAPEPR